MDFGGVSLPVASTEDLIIYKAIAWRERDRLDIERLLRVHHGWLDMERILDWVAQFAAALDEPERVAQFNALLARVLKEIG